MDLSNRHESERNSGGGLIYNVGLICVRWRFRTELREGKELYNDWRDALHVSRNTPRLWFVLGECEILIFLFMVLIYTILATCINGLGAHSYEASSPLCHLRLSSVPTRRYH